MGAPSLVSDSKSVVYIGGTDLGNKATFATSTFKNLYIHPKFWANGKCLCVCAEGRREVCYAARLLVNSGLVRACVALSQAT